MKWTDKILQLLQKPFPVEESTGGILRTIAFVSLFVTLFLYIFQPFNLSEVESGKLIICLGFGGMTFLACVLYEFVISRLAGLGSRRENFNFGWWIIHMTGIMLTISVVNFLFIRLFFFGYIRWEFLPNMITSTFAIGLFPVVVIGGLAMLQQEKKYLHLAQEINQRKPDVPGPGPASNLTIFDIPLSRVRFVEALQNYVKIGFVNAEGQYRELTERATLKSIEDETEGGFIVKCHRSFLVNRNAIVDAAGNAQGLVLSLADCDKTIPVSRSYVPVFREN